MKLSPWGSQVLIDREGCVLTAYEDSVGVLTIGVGHTSAAGEPEVEPGMSIAMSEAWRIFAQDNDMFEEVVNEAITAPMEQHQFDAFTSICFNIGGGAFSSATFVKSFNAGASPDQVTAEILWWDIPSEIVPRRQGEAVQFRDAVYVARIDPMPPPSATA
jgi:lysozyme